MLVGDAMLAFLTKLLLVARSRLKSRASLEAENLVLRQQVIVLSRKSPARVRLWNIDRLLLVWLYRLYPSLLDAIIIVQPETVIRWHRRGFRAYWRWKSRHVGGRPRIDREIRALIRRMSRRIYFLQASTDLSASSPFSVVQSNILGQVGTTTFLDTNSITAGTRFYRVGIQQ